MVNNFRNLPFFMDSYYSRMPAVTGSQLPFRFLDLPPEMRNIVYQYLQETYDDVEDREDLIAAGCAEEEELVAYVQMIQPNLRQVNRQIRDEVEKQMRLDTTFVFEETDPGFFENTYPKFLRSMITQYTNHVIVKLQAWYLKTGEFNDVAHSGLTCTKNCTAVADIRNHAYFARKFLESFPHTLKSLEIEISLLYTDDANHKFQWTDAQHEPGLFKALEKLAAIPRLTALRVVKDNIREDILWMTWDRKGWQNHTKTEVDR